MRTIGVLAAIAALPGLLSGSLVARPWDGPGHGPSIQGAASALSVRTELPAPIQQEMMLEARGASSLPRPALIVSPVAGGPVLAVSPSASFPATTETRATVPALNGATPLSFRLEDTLALRVSRGTSPVIRGPYDRLSPDHVGVPGFAETAAGTSYGPKPDQLEAVKADISETAAESAPVPAVSAPDTGPVQNAEAAKHAVLAKAETNSVRTRMVGHAAPRGTAVPGIVRPGQQKVASPPGLQAPVPPQEMAAQQQQSFDYRPGTRAFPAEQTNRAFDLDDELILQIKIKGIASSDTVVAYGTREALYLPLGEISRILDLAIRVSDDGHYANGWFLEEARTLTVNLREQRLTTRAGERPLKPGEAQAFDGEMFLRSELFSEIFPLELQPNLRAQAIYLSTLEPFPFEERIRREAERARLGARDRAPDQQQWPRQETPWLAASLPLADVELRAISDSPMGNRLEGDLRFGGDLAFMTAQSYFSATTRDGLVASLVQLGRRDTDGNLLGPLEATDFQFGDVATSSMPVGLHQPPFPEHIGVRANRFARHLAHRIRGGALSQ